MFKENLYEKIKENTKELYTDELSALFLHINKLLMKKDINEYTFCLSYIINNLADKDIKLDIKF